MVFRSDQHCVRWTTRALRNVKSNSLEQITFRPDLYTFTNPIQDATYQEWWDFDHPLVQFRISRSICPKAVYEMKREEEMRGCALSLLPELTRRVLVRSSSVL